MPLSPRLIVNYNKKIITLYETIKKYSKKLTISYLHLKNTANIMEGILSLSELLACKNYLHDFVRHGDDYAFRHFTEEDAQLIRSDGPIRFDGIIWILCFGGSVEVDINLLPTPLTANSVLLTRAGSFAELKSVDWKNLDCYVLLISRDFIRDINFDLNILHKLPPMVRRGINTPPMINLTETEARVLRSYYEVLQYNNMNPQNEFSKAIARNTIASLTYQLIQLVQKLLPEEEPQKIKNRRSNYVTDFFNLVHKHHRRERHVTFYADKLFISAKYLSLIIKEATGQTAAEIIDDYVILEAKNQLRYTDKNIQQISYDLNFPNQSSFGKYFKHLTGMSPSQYQRAH